ncbi:hypothetical protein LUZ61_012678 [Rhynchospora tenuis]|uniref:Small ribosomal subunit protein uS14m n=1 Tax=Rhynchospora tenuis TaxID=198213 RepID=A0AAD6F1R4_9POAL|nr:hypothetical protein LUZ61_012678 [Rhynchospora tenuis]
MMMRQVTTVADKVADKRNIGDYKRRLLAAKYELRRNLYKTLWQDPNLPSDLRDKYRHKLSRLPRNSSFTRVRNRCIFSSHFSNFFYYLFLNINEVDCQLGYR